MAGELDHLLSQFAERHNLPGLQAKPDGRFFLLLDGDLEISVLQGGDRIYLEGRLSPLPADQRRAEEQLSKQLRIHLTRLRNNQEVLSLDPDSEELVLFRQLPARALAIADFEQALEDFANSLEFWTDNAAEPTRTSIPLPMQMLFP